MNTLEWLKNISQLAQEGHIEEAQSSCRALLMASPENIDAHGLLGRILISLGSFDEAISHLQKIEQAGVKDANVFYDLADALTSSGKFSEAVGYYVQAISLVPDWPELHFNLGFVMQCLGRHEHAIQNYLNALKLRPGWVDARNNLGLELIEMERPEEAISQYKQALALAPNYANAVNNLGLALADAGRFDEAISSYQRAIVLKPDYFEAHNNLGVSFLELCRYDDALREFQQSATINPSYHRARFNEAIALLSLGELQDGFRAYEARWNTPKFPTKKPELNCPQWFGDDDLSGKSVFVFAEQGLGDTIQFCRYLPLLAKKTARLTVAVPDSIKDLLGTLPGEMALVAPGGDPAGYDFHIPMCSLPLAFNTSTGNIPSTVPYLAVPQTAQKKLANLPKATDSLNIGLCWRSGSRHRLLKKRDMPLRELLVSLKNSQQSARIFSLQKDVTAAEKRMLVESSGIVDLGSGFADFSDTAAAITCMDLVISVDTSVAHLCGALGIPVWIALMYSPDWRWLPASNQSLWYPSARLFRQPALGDWSGVGSKISAALPLFKGIPF